MISVYLYCVLNFSSIKLICDEDTEGWHICSFVGDVLVFVDDQCVLGYSHRNIINLFQSIPVGETVKIEVCRGYPLPFDPDDPNNEVITTVAVTAAADLTPTNNLLPVGVGWNSPGSKLMVVGHGVHVNADESSANSDTSSAVFQHSPKLLTVDIVRGPMGFGFTIADSVHGQRVKQLLDRPRCQGLMEGDLLVEINGRIVRDMKHTSVVEVLQKCPINSTASFLVQRGGQMCLYLCVTSLFFCNFSFYCCAFHLVISCHVFIALTCIRSKSRADL